MEPLKLRIKNFFSIADGEIDFTKFSSALLIGHYEDNVLKSNGSGKSSALEGIGWCLFNKTRQAKAEDVIRWDQNECSVEFEFLFAGKEYKVVRKRSRITKETAISLFTRDGDSWHNESGAVNTDTNKKILDLLKIDHTIFLNSVYFKQHDISLFANSSPTERKDILKSILKLEKWDVYQKTAKDKLKSIVAEIEKHSRIIDENQNLQAEKEQNSQSISDLQDFIGDIATEQQRVKNKLHILLGTKKENNAVYLQSIKNEKVDRLNELKKQGKEIQNDKAASDKRLETATTQHHTLTKKITGNEKELITITAELESFETINCSYPALDDSILANKVEMGRLKGILNELDETADLLGLGQCQVCLTDIDENNLPHIHENRKKKQEETQAELNDVSVALLSLEAEYKKRKNNKAKLDQLTTTLNGLQSDIDRATISLDKLVDDIQEYENTSAKLTNSLNTIMEQFGIVKAEIVKIDERIANTDDDSADKEITALERSSNELLATINSKNQLLGSLLREREFLVKRNEQNDIAKNQLFSSANQKISYEQLVRYFGKDGIQAVFIDSIVGELEEQANQTLSHICNEPTVIRLRTQKKTKDEWQETLEIDVIMSGQTQTFESLSGGEKFRISLALRVGLSEVLVKRAGGEIKFLLLDEVDSPLDTHGLNNLFENIIKGLEKRFKILVISHSSSIKERFDDVISVVKTSNGSFIHQE